MRLGFYYSQAQDWHEPERRRQHLGLRPRRQEGLRPVPARARPSRRCRSCSPATARSALIWFDTPADDERRSARSASPTSCATLQPKTLIDGRLGAAGRLRHDGRQRDPGRGRQARRGRCRRRSTTPGATRRTTTTGSRPATSTFKLVDIVSKGGNYLLNVGPDGRRRDPAAEPGHAARRGPLAEGERRGDLRRRSDAVRRRARASRARRERRTCAATRCSSSRNEWRVHHEARQAVHHLLHGAARAVRAAADEERGEARLPAGRRAPVEVQVEDGRPGS